MKLYVGSGRQLRAGPDTFQREQPHVDIATSVLETQSVPPEWSLCNIRRVTSRHCFTDKR
jgi:hypothetical protein